MSHHSQHSPHSHSHSHHAPLPHPAFSGLYTALITPFIRGKDIIDEEGFLLLLDRQQAAQVDGILLLGTTAEGTLLTHAEENQLIALAVNHIKAARSTFSTLSPFVCIHCASTQAACQRAKEIKDLGASGLLVLTPPYVRPTQEGLYLHFAAILRATSLPMCIYNNPSRTGCHLELETLKRLASFSHLVGIKDCSGNLSHITSCTEYMRKHHPQFSLMSGDDAYTLPLMALGYRGLFSVASNLFPHTLRRLVSLCLQDDFQAARLLHEKLLPLFQTLFLEPNPIPIKEAMEFLKLPSGGCRLPLSPMQERYRMQLHTILNDTLAYFKDFENV